MLQHIARPRMARLWMGLLVLLVALSPVTALAAPAAQFGSLVGADAADGAQPLPLGQYGVADLENGDSVTYEVVIPESALYLITAVDDVAAQDFDLLVTDETGAELYDDIFGTVELELQPGTVTLQFTAVADNALVFVVLGQIGALSDDEDQPGQLVPGSFYIGESISGARYATISVPATTYPQQVLVYLEPGEGDDFYAYVEGENVYSWWSSDSGDSLLRFWTYGGDYTLMLEPYDRRSSITAIVFLTGQPTPVEFDVPLEDNLPAGGTEVIYELQVDASYTNLELAVEGDEELGVTLLDTYYNSNVYYSSYGEASTTIDSLFPGVYYVLVQATEAYEEDVAFTLTITGEAGRPAVALENGVPYEDTFQPEEASILYTFDVTTPGALISVSIVDAPADTDFDLNAGIRPGYSNWSIYAYGSEDVLVFAAPIAGTYYVNITSNGSDGDFTILVEEGDLAPMLGSGDVVVGTVAAGGRAAYILPIDKAGQILTVALVGPTDVDLDLVVTGYNANGDNVFSSGGYSGGSAEITSFISSEPGLYEIAVNGAYIEEDANFFIQAQAVDPRFFAGQWAVDAVASSAFGSDGYSALQATGAPDTPTPGDLPTAWASQDPDGGAETLELAYGVPVNPAAIAIYETYNPGSIVLIEAYNADADEWVVLWEGAVEESDTPFRIYSPALAPVDFVTDQIRLTLDTSVVTGWNEIDAVQLFGRP